MDLQLFFSTVLKHRRVIVLGLFLGLIVLALASYSVAFDFQSIYQWPFTVTPRSTGYYETSIDLAIDSPNFGMGSAGISPKSWQAFGRSIELAPTYAYIISSDFMRKRVGARIGKLSNEEQITSENVEKTPIFAVKVEGPDRQRTRRIATVAVDELRAYISDEQESERTPNTDRAIIREIGPPANPKPSQSFYPIKLSLAFLSPVLLAIIMAFVIENVERPADFGDKR